MQEQATGALMELFAIAASLNDRGLSYRNRSIVESYVKLSLPVHDKATHLLHYAHHLKNYQEWKEKEIIPVIERACSLCNSLMSDLTSSDRISVVLHIMDIASTDNRISGDETALLNAIAQEFKVPDVELEELGKLGSLPPEALANEKNFILASDLAETPGDELEGSWIERNKPREKESNRSIHRAGLKGTIVFLHLESVNAFALRYTGEAEILIGTRALQPGRLALLSIEDKISGKRLSPILFSELLVLVQPADSRSRLSLHCRKLGFIWKNSSFKVHPFSVSAESGSMIAITGEKNSGKSTILRILSGELRNYMGSVKVNGYELKLEWYKLRNLIGHVPEMDIIINELSVYDNFYYNARLCFSNSGREEIRHRINKLLEFLDIKDIRQLLPDRSKLTVFERKKINIGLELLKDPQVLLLDEPMTGLSSSEAESMAKLLKSLAAGGKMVIASLHHAPARAFKHFQNVWILDDEGYMVYTGPTEEALNYFSAEREYSPSQESLCEECAIFDPERIFETIRSRKINEKGHFVTERKKSPMEWHHLYKEKIEKKLEFHEGRKILPQVLFIHPNLGIQNLMYALRYLKIWSNRKLRLLLFLILPAVVALLIAFLCRYSPGASYSFAQNSNIPLYFFLEVLLSITTGMLLSADEYVRYRHRLIREEVITLTNIGSLNVRTMILLAVGLLQTLLITLAGNYLLQIRGMTLLVWLILFSSASFGILLGLALSSVFRSRLTIYMLIPVLLVPEILLGGTAIDYAHLPKPIRNERYVPMLADLMVSRWGYEALMVNQFKNNPYERNYYDIDRKISQDEIYGDIIIPAIQAKVMDITGQFQPAYGEDTLASKLLLIRNELNDLATTNDVFPFEFLAKLEPKSFSKEIDEETMDYLAFIRNQFYEKTEALKSRRDSVDKALEKRLGNEGVDNLKKTYYNESLAERVKNMESQVVIKEAGGRFVPQKFQIYLFPDSKLGRAHFFAPYKLLNGQYVNTELFNLLAIWLLTFALYMLVISEVLELAYVSISAIIPRSIS